MRAYLGISKGRKSSRRPENIIWYHLALARTPTAISPRKVLSETCKTRWTWKKLEGSLQSNTSIRSKGLTEIYDVQSVRCLAHSGHLKDGDTQGENVKYLLQERCTKGCWRQIWCNCRTRPLLDIMPKARNLTLMGTYGIQILYILLSHLLYTSSIV